MIYYYDEYKEFVLKEMHKVNVMLFPQLRLMLKNKFNITSDLAAEVIFVMQKKGYFFITETGIVITKQLYQTWSHDKFYDNVSKNQNIVQLPDKFYVYGEPNGEYQQTEIASFTHKLARDTYRRDIVHSMWIVADFMPKSEDFTLGYAPWAVNFCMEDDQKNYNLYQVTVSTSRTIPAKSALILENGKVKDKTMQQHIFRIALVEKEEDKFFVPYMGFGMIAMLDQNSDCGYRVVEERNGTAFRWKDCPC